MKRTFSFVVALSALFPSITYGVVTIDTVLVGNAGNSSDGSGLGAVSYDYRIGKHEVTNNQYVEFLNAVADTDSYGLFNPFMASEAQGGITQSGSPGSHTYGVKVGQGDMPVVFVSFWDAARYAN